MLLKRDNFEKAVKRIEAAGMQQTLPPLRVFSAKKHEAEITTLYGGAKSGGGGSSLCSNEVGYLNRASSKR